MAGLNQMHSDLKILKGRIWRCVGQKVKQIPEQQNPCWQWSTPVLLPYCTESAQKNITEKAHTLPHSLSYSNRFKQQQKQKLTKLDHKYSTALSTGSKKSSVWPPLSRVHSARLTSRPPQIPSEHDSAERKWKHESRTHSVLSAKNKLQIKEKWLVNKQFFLSNTIAVSFYRQSTEISTDINFISIQASLH